MLDQGKHLDMEALSYGFDRQDINKPTSRLLRQDRSEEIMDLSDQANMISLSEKTAGEQERDASLEKRRRQVTVAAGSLLLEMLDLLPEPVMPRSLHEQLLTADLSDRREKEGYIVLSQAPPAVRSLVFHSRC